MTFCDELHGMTYSLVPDEPVVATSIRLYLILHLFMAGFVGHEASNLYYTLNPEPRTPTPNPKPQTTSPNPETRHGRVRGSRGVQLVLHLRRRPDMGGASACAEALLLHAAPRFCNRRSAPMIEG